jgi:hypothetical protein
VWLFLEVETEVEGLDLVLPASKTTTNGLGLVHPLKMLLAKIE